MLRTFLRQSLVALAAVALYLPIALYYGDSAHAGSISWPANCSLNGPDSGGNYSVNCGSPGQFSCSITAQVPSPSTTTVEVLTAGNCANATGSVTFSSWNSSGAGCPGIASTTSNSVTLNTAAGAVSGCSYSVTATDQATPTPNSATPSISLTFTSGGGGGGPINCNSPVGASNITPSATHVVPMTWGGPQVFTSNYGGFHPGDAIVVKFHTPVAATAAGQSSPGSMDAIEYIDAGVARYGALSNNACDFTVGLPMRNRSGVPNGCGYSLIKGASHPATGISAIDKGTCVVVLQPDTDYFWNIINFDPATGINNCSGGTCNMVINGYWPAGTF